MALRYFTVDEANALVPDLESALAAARRHMDAMRDARDQLNDLRIVWADAIDDESNPDHAEYESYRRAFVEAEEALRDVMQTIRTWGCEVKDAEAGLVDFYSKRGGEVVFLCWRAGESSVQFWHTLAGGFAARKPITRPSTV